MRSRHVLPLMRKQNSGQIITIASMSGRRGAALQKRILRYKICANRIDGIVEDGINEYKYSNAH